MPQGRNAGRKLLSFINILGLGIILFRVLKYCNIDWEKYIGKMNLFVANACVNESSVI